MKDDKKGVSGSLSSPSNEGRSSKYLYKQSTLQTEGNSSTNLKKKGMHIKLTSIASDVKDSVNTDSDHQGGEDGVSTPPSRFSPHYKVSSHERTDSNLLQIGSGEYEELFEGCDSENTRPNKKKRKSKNSVLSMRSESMSELMKQRNGTEKVKNLINIRRIEGSKTIDPIILS